MHSVHYDQTSFACQVNDMKNGWQQKAFSRDTASYVQQLKLLHPYMLMGIRVEYATSIVESSLRLAPDLKKLLLPRLRRYCGVLPSLCTSAHARFFLVLVKNVVCWPNSSYCSLYKFFAIQLCKMMQPLLQVFNFQKPTYSIFFWNDLKPNQTSIPLRTQFFFLSL